MALFASVLALTSPIGQTKPSFQGLGVLPNGSGFSRAYAVSADGTVAVGESVSGLGLEAFRWTEAEGIVGLGDLPPDPFESVALGISADGLVVVGHVRVGDGQAAFWEAFRWTAETGLVGLGDLPGGIVNSEGFSASNDGSVVVGGGQTGEGFKPFRWEAGSMMELEDLGGPPSYGSEAFDINYDGSIIVGISTVDPCCTEAFRWTAKEGMVGLGDLPAGLFRSTAHAVSASGTIIVGEGASSFGTEAVRWTDGEGPVSLGDLAGGNTDSRAYDVSDDGSVIVGQAHTSLGKVAFIWDPRHGIRSLQDLLQGDLGLDLSGWTLREATAVSADGKTIVGWGEHPGVFSEAWIVYIPTEALDPCKSLADCADVDGDGVRDENCLWWSCTTGICQSTETVFADLGGEFGNCSPDGLADGHDRFHVLNCFSNVGTTGAPGYPCEDAPPAAFNVDAGGPFGDCAPDGVCDGNDAFQALNAFDSTTTCTCLLDGGPSPGVARKPLRRKQR